MGRHSYRSTLRRDILQATALCLLNVTMFTVMAAVWASPTSDVQTPQSAYQSTHHVTAQTLHVTHHPTTRPATSKPAATRHATAHHQSTSARHHTHRLVHHTVNHHAHHHRVHRHAHHRHHRHGHHRPSNAREITS